MMKRILVGIAVAGFLMRLAIGGEELGPHAEQPRNATELLTAFSSVKYFWQQREVAEEMIRIGDKSLISIMEPYLSSASRHERCNAGLVLVGLGDRRGASLLIRELRDQTPRPTKLRRSDGRPYPEGQVIEDRYYAAFLLGRLKERDAVPALIAATKDKSINYQAAISLGQIGDRSALPALQTMIEEFPEQRLWAGYGLAGLGEPAGFDILTETIEGSNWVDRRHAIEAIGSLGAHQLKPLLLKSLKDERVEVRISAAFSLERLGDSDDLPALTEALRVAEVNIMNATDFKNDDDLTRETQFTNVATKTVKVIKSKLK